MEQTFDAFQDAAAASAEPTARAPAPAARPRYDIYINIHKALRAAMADALLALGRLDSGDAREVTDAVVRVDALLDFCRHHLEKENAYIHPAMEARQPGSTRRIANEHVEHEASIARMQRLLDALARAPGTRREAAAHELYHELSWFVGENLVHMHEEETSHNATLRDCYSDAELAALEQTIRANLSPAEMQYGMRWMLPAMTPGARAGMLQDVRAHAPAPVYQGLLAAARAHVDPEGVRKLEAALEV